MVTSDDGVWQKRNGINVAPVISWDWMRRCVLNYVMIGVRCIGWGEFLTDSDMRLWYPGGMVNHNRFIWLAARLSFPCSFDILLPVIRVLKRGPRFCGSGRHNGWWSAVIHTKAQRVLIMPRPLTVSVVHGVCFIQRSF